MEANFVRKLKRGKGKYKGKLPFKSSNYGDIRYCLAKYPYKKKEDNEEESHKEKSNMKKSNFKRNKLYSSGMCAYAKQLKN